MLSVIIIFGLKLWMGKGLIYCGGTWNNSFCITFQYNY